jgi:hypothetical protein
MRITTSYIGTRKEGKNYLFFLLTETYINQNKRIMESLKPLLTQFSRDLNSKGALIMPYEGDERNTLNDVLKKGWSHEDIARMRSSLPAILVTDVDFDVFDARNCNYACIFLRESMSEHGDVNVFELQEILEHLSSGTWINSLFRDMKAYYSKQRRDSLWKATELKPEIIGFSFDLKQALQFFRERTMISDSEK